MCSGIQQFPRNGIYNLECLVGVAKSSLHNDTITLLLVKTASWFTLESTVDVICSGKSKQLVRDTI